MRAFVAIALALVGCGSSASDGAPGGAASRGVAARDPLLAVPLPPGAARVTGPNFQVDAAPLGACTVAAPCVVAADLTALAGFKVNAEYPFKLVEPSVGLVAPAAFAVTGTTTGRLLVRFTRPGAGPVRVTGGFKLSVCSADVCQIETARLAVDVP